RQLAARDSSVKKLTLRKNDLQKELDSMDKDTKVLEVVKDWNKRSVPLLDEIRLLKAQFPDIKTHRVTEFTLSEASGRGNKHVPQIFFKGTYTADSDRQITNFLDGLARNPHYQVVEKRITPADQTFQVRLNLLSSPVAKSRKE